MEKIKALVETQDIATLDRYNQYPVHTPFFDLDYGKCQFGIFSAACPVESLHSLDLGLIEHSLKLLFNAGLRSTENKLKLDRLIAEWSNMSRQRHFTAGTCPTYPRLVWNEGVTKLTQLTGKDKYGIMVTVVLISLTTPGRKLFVDALGAEKTAAMQECFQMLICYRQWLKKKSYWKLGDRHAANQARQAVQTMCGRLKRRKG